MIITVTLNPAIDKTIELPNLVRGGLNRLQNVVTDAGGKGINVSKTIKALGGSTLATGFLGKTGGKVIIDCLEREGIPHDFVMVNGDIRTNMKIVEQDGIVTELNETGPVIEPAAVAMLMDKLQKYASKSTIFILSGSIPAGVPNDIYVQIMQSVRKHGAQVYIDADGDTLKMSMDAVPDFVKPNQFELADYFGDSSEMAEGELVERGRQLVQKGITHVVISRGREGALFFRGDQTIKCKGLSVPAASTVGAGDAIVAAYAYAMQAGMDEIERVKFALAASAGAVTTKGTKPPAKSLVEELQKKVEVEFL